MVEGLEQKSVIGGGRHCESKWRLEKPTDFEEELIGPKQSKKSKFQGLKNATRMKKAESPNTKSLHKQFSQRLKSITVDFKPEAENMTFLERENPLTLEDNRYFKRGRSFSSNCRSC